jgi:hypothetical protein
LIVLEVAIVTPKGGNRQRQSFARLNAIAGFVIPELLGLNRLIAEHPDDAEAAAFQRNYGRVILKVCILARRLADGLRGG